MHEKSKTQFLGYLQEMQFKCKDTDWLNVIGQKK